MTEEQRDMTRYVFIHLVEGISHPHDVAQVGAINDECSRRKKIILMSTDDQIRSMGVKSTSRKDRNERISEGISLKEKAKKHKSRIVK
jgi:hypothetical protein